MSQNSSLFITVEGGEGAGKTTLIDQLEHALKAMGRLVVRTREPGGTPFGEQMRNWLLSHHESISISDKAELLLFLAARAQHIDEVIAPALREGKIVLCDRFNDSTIAYQGAARGLGVDWVKQLCLSVCGQTLPQLTFYLDIEPEVGLARTKRIAKDHALEGCVDRIEAEQLTFHQKVRQAFLTLAAEEPTRFCCVDGSLPQKQVQQRALERLQQYV